MVGCSGRSPRGAPRAGRVHARKAGDRWRATPLAVVVARAAGRPAPITVLDRGLAGRRDRRCSRWPRRPAQQLDGGLLERSGQWKRCACDVVRSASPRSRGAPCARPSSRDAETSASRRCPMCVCSPAAMPSCASCMPASAAQTCGPTAAACPRSPVRIGHEFLGVVEAIGSEVEEVVVGDLVLSPFTWSDGNCEQCQRGLPSACVRGGFFGGPVADGGQGEAVRVPQADGTLVKLPSELAGDDRLRSRPAADRGHADRTACCGARRRSARRHGRRRGRRGGPPVRVLAASRLGAERVIALAHHEERLTLAGSSGRPTSSPCGVPRPSSRCAS